MAVTYQKPSRIGNSAIRLRFTSDRTPPVPFRVVREGLVVGAFSSPDGTGWWDFPIAPGDEFPFIEVLDKNCQIPAIASPGRFTLHWLSVSGTDLYRVEELVNAVWTLRQEVPDDGRGAFLWRSRWLEDTTTHQFRVVPVSPAGNQGTPISFVALMVRHPDPPDVTYTYNQAPRTLTIGAA